MIFSTWISFKFVHMHFIVKNLLVIFCTEFYWNKNRKYRCLHPNDWLKIMLITKTICKDCDDRSLNVTWMDIIFFFRYIIELRSNGLTILWWTIIHQIFSSSHAYSCVIFFLVLNEMTVFYFYWDSYGYFWRLNTYEFICKTMSIKLNNCHNDFRRWSYLYCTKTGFSAFTLSR